MFLSVCNFDCSFNENLCTWSQIVTDAFAWTLNNESNSAQITDSSTKLTGNVVLEKKILNGKLFLNNLT